MSTVQSSELFVKAWILSFQLSFSDRFETTNSSQKTLRRIVLFLELNGKN